MRLLTTQHSTHKIGIHLIWCPKYRHQVLEGPIEVHLKRILAEVCKDNDWPIQAIEIMPDHVHLFLQLDPFTAPVDAVKLLKSISAVQLFLTFPELKKSKFWGSGMWSRSTYYGSVGEVSEEIIRKYIEKQRG